MGPFGSGESEASHEATPTVPTLLIETQTLSAARSGWGGRVRHFISDPRPYLACPAGKPEASKEGVSPPLVKGGILCPLPHRAHPALYQAELKHCMRRRTRGSIVVKKGGPPSKAARGRLAGVAPKKQCNQLSK